MCSNGNMAGHMNEKIISVNNLGKKYRIGQRESYKSLRDSLAATALWPVKKMQAALNGNQHSVMTDDVFWALKDVSFDVCRGEVIGVIGRNGAGKSTLLKILTRITEPTEGIARLRGRVGSLLEVGTGFHPELTGRENIYLNGSILGMRKVEIENKFDEIVDFAEVEKFIDTPVKFYSSGMYVRLAFAVAAHLEPEILLIDEVLAVGDAAFQKKCLGKMEDVSQKGRTILFVSHNMVAVQSLCHRAIWLQDGKVKKVGESAQIVSNYLHEGSSISTDKSWDDINTAPGNDTVRLRRVCIRPENGTSSDTVDMQTPFVIEFEFWKLDPDSNVNLNFHLLTEQQVIAFASSSPKIGQFPPGGIFRSTCYIPGNLLNAGQHYIRLRIVNNARIIYQHNEELSFEVRDAKKRAGAWFGRWVGAVHPVLEWTSEMVGEETALMNKNHEKT